MAETTFTVDFPNGDSLPIAVTTSTASVPPSNLLVPHTVTFGQQKASQFTVTLTPGTVVTPPTPSAPVNTVRPTISGTAAAGQILTATNGTWTNNPTSYTYAWQRGQNGNYVQVDGATGLTYALTSADVGYTLDIVVTAKNASGTATAASVVTAVVTGTTPPPPPPTSGPVSGVAVGAQLAVYDFVNDPTAFGKLSHSWFNGGTQNNIVTDPANVVLTSNGIELSLANGKGASINTNPQDAANPGFLFTTGYMEVLATFSSMEGEQPSINYHSSNGANNGPSVSGNWLGTQHAFGISRGAQGNVYYDKVLERTFTIEDGDAPHYFVANVGSGAWSAVWDTGESWPSDGEDDDAEDYGPGNAPDGVYLTIAKVTFWAAA